MRLLSDNDWKVLAAALERREVVELVRSLGSVTIQAETAPVGKPWTVPMVVSVRMESGHLVRRQNFENIHAARRAVEDWNV